MVAVAVTRSAVAAVLGSRGPRGTAFAVSATRWLTCWHCIAHPRDLTELEDAAVALRLDPDTTVRAVHVDHDVDLDVAVLELATDEALPPGWVPLPLGHDRDLGRGGAVDCLGWPFHNPSTAEPQTMAGELTVRHERGDLPALEIYSRQVAVGLRPGGFSGGPVVLEPPFGGAAGRTAVGVVAWMQEEAADRGRAVAGTVYAVPVGAIAERWPDLMPAVEPADLLAGGADAIGRSTVGKFVAAHLRGAAGGRLPFAGRDAELATLDAWVTAPDAWLARPYRLVSGPAGAGKSTLLVWWAESLVAGGRTDTEVVFVPVSVRYEANADRDVFEALVSRIAAVHGVPYDRSASAKGLRDALAGLLARAAPDGVTLVVIVDGLDEAADWEPGPQHFPAAVGARVRVLLSARHTRNRASAAAWLERLGLSGVGTGLDLGRLAAEAFESLVRQAIAPAVAPDDLVRAVAAELARLTEGEPVTLALYLRQLSDPPGGDLTGLAAALKRARAGLEGYFDDWWEDQRRLWQARAAGQLADAERILGLLAVAEGPIALRDLRTLAGQREPVDGTRLRHALEQLDRFLLPAGEPDTVVIAHPLIIEMLRARLARYGELAEYQESYVTWARDVLRRVVDGEVAPRDVSGYLARHLVQHLVPAPHEVAPVPLAEVYRLTDPAWRQVREWTADDLEAYSRDVAAVAARAGAENRRALTAGRPLPALPEQNGCAATIAGDATASGPDLTPALAAEFLRHGLWRPARALACVAGESSDGFRSDGIEAIAPLVGEDDLPRLQQLVESLEDSYVEAVQPATAAWARRLVELGRPDEAIAAAAWLAPEHRLHTAVRLWTLAELIPRLPARLVPTALDQLFDTVDESSEPMTFELCHLTKQVPLSLAESLWTGDPLGWLLLHLGGYGQPRPFLQDLGPLALTEDYFGRPRMYGGWAVDGRSFVAAARWLTDDQRYGTLVPALLDIGDEPGDDSFLLRAQVLPSLHYDGLLSVLPPDLAAEVAQRVLVHVDGADRASCLLQLAPMLTGADRETGLEVAFASVADLADIHINEVRLIVPAIAAAGLADRFLDTVEGGKVSDFYWWFKYLAPHLDRPGTERALAIVRTDPTPGYRARRFVLPQLASFGAAEATRALELLHESDVSATTMAQVNGLLAEPGLPLNGAGRLRVPWWERCTYPGVARQWSSGIWSYPATPGVPLPPDGTGDERLDQAYAFVASPSDDGAAELLETAGTVVDAWVALTLLAAATHRPGPDRVAPILDRLDRLRERSLAKTWAMDGFPADVPWLVRGIDDWTPFFVRLLAPEARAAVKRLLFDGGYLDGVLKRHTAFGDTHDRLDDWAHDVLALTPILDRDELDALMALHRDIKSESTRKAFRGGIAVALADLGDTETAYDLASGLAWQSELLRLSVTRDILPGLPTAAVPGWIAHVHRCFGDPDDRAELWYALNDRWLEFDRAQLWAVVEQWCAQRYRSRDDVYRDAVAYRYAIAQLGGPAELARLQRLLLGGLPQGGQEEVAALGA